MENRINPLLHPFRLLEQKALFVPEKSFRGTPQHVGLEYTDIHPVTADRIRLHGWHMPHSNNAPRNPVWLILHGNGGNISVRLDQYKEIHRRHAAAIIAFDYRGYGQSEGQPSETGLYADALAAYEYTRKLYPDEKIIVFGRSMGGAVASQLASVVAPAALILEASISSMPEIIKERAPWLRYFPLGLISSASFKTTKYVSGGTVPKLIFHGDSDQTVSYRHSERIFEAASYPKQLKIIANGNHDGLDLVDPDEYHSVVNQFLTRNWLL